jgi:NAD(P)-dependent dehydrogenase (short-subunit alcohol dehydrogenase family)
MTQEFAGRVVIVTGAGKGIGQATAIAFSRLGAHVVLSGQSKDPLMQTLALVKDGGGMGGSWLSAMWPLKKPHESPCR